jgi:branched-chain amino acid transport system substrate-binding protein
MTLVGVAAVFMASNIPAQAQDVKVGFVTTLSGGAAAIGNEMRDGFELGLDQLGRKLGGLDAVIIYEDDQLKPEVGKQKTAKLVESDKVNFLTGYLWSNVLLASLKIAVESETFLISSNAGPSQIAGELCSPWFFTTSWQGQQVVQAIGEYMNQKGVMTAYLMAPNYVAGRDIITGLKAIFTGQVAGEDYTRWPDQLDFSVELSKARAAKPDAIFGFYPGGAGVQFLNQYSQFGLRGQIPLYTLGILDELSIPRLKDLALGIQDADHWVNDLPNDANKRFVAGFRKKYGRNPSAYAARSYDAAFLIDSAVKATGGDLTKKDAMRDAMRKANFASVRGPYKYGNNHFPIQNFYLQEVVATADGNYALRTVATALTANQDRYHDHCPMKW